jgi:hypothetical protein
MEDGSLKAVGKDADKASAALDKAGRSGDKYQKVQKGIAQTGLSSGKSFSKMAGSIQSGLVPAYATLAAHVFAVTAAFGVLSRAQAVRQLNEGLLFTGRAAGDNLTIVTKNLKEITENAISSADAMRALAVGVSAGFSESQMEGLTRVAKGASLALGRDMTDALDRLVRGAAKLEPEILDELGIMVRLDDATEKYAASLGVAASELTQFERRMAFTNEIIDQGQTKFGALSQAVESNPFNQLAATFDNLVKSGMNLLNTVFGPIAGFLAGSTTALVAAVGALGTGVVTMMIPALTEGGRAAREYANEMADAAKQSIAGTKAVKGSPKVFTDLSKKIASGTASTKDFKDATGSLEKSIATHKRQMPGYIKQYGASSQEVAKKTAKLKANENALSQLTHAQLLEAQATRKGAQADIFAQASAGNFRVTLQLLRAEIAAVRVQTALDTAGKSLLAAAYQRVSMWAGIAAMSVKAFGLALVSSIPIIGQVILGAMLLWEGVKWLFGSDAEKTVSPLADVLKQGEERFAEFPNIVNQMADAYDAAATASERYLISIKAQNGVLKQTLAQVRNLRIAEEVNAGMDISAAQRKLKAAQEAEKAAKKALADINVSTDEGEEVGFFARLKERMVGRNYREGVDSPERLALIATYNQALQDQAAIQTTINQLEAAAGGPSQERFLATERALREFIKTSQHHSSQLEKGSDEYNKLHDDIDAVQDIINNLSEDNLPAAEAALNALSASTNKTVHSFQALRDAGAEVDALFAKNAQVSGTFATEIKILDKGLEALTRTLPSEAQLEELAAAFKKFGVSDEDELKSLKDRYAAINTFRKEEAYWDQLSKNQRDKLNRAGLKDVALADLSSEQEVKRLALIEERTLAIRAGEDGLKQDLEILKLASKQEKTRLDIINERVAKQTRLGGSDMGAAMSGSAYIEKNREAFDAAKTSDQIRMVATAMEPLMANIRALGPEGELVAALGAGSFAMGEAFTALSEKIEEKTATTADKLQAAAAAINTIAQITAAASKAKIDGIDREIAAEQRRDGKSAASIQKIAALEKKKQAAQKKAFEVNKKMQMAQVAIAVAASIAHNITAASAAAAASGLAAPAVFSGVLGMLNAVTLGLGAAQIAIISGTSYQGGGGTPSAGSGGASSISVGSRDASVDLAKGQNAGGELAYARGESGIGSGMTDFKPTSAFAGYKHRAGGGYVVGEQGPELFMPDTPGQIIPSGQGTGGQTNVNFSISAVDATGVEDLLMNQRGNIIGMIREAANEHGEMFLEGVQEKSY